jgi:eukaryotic-like serine/threonine-protein kinase
MRNKVGHYEIVQELGRGGMGVVYKGFEPQLSRHVAIKLMSEALAHDQQIVERFLREAKSMAQLNDPHIIQIYLIGEDQGQPFFAMEFVEGESLSQTLRREGKIEPKRAAGIIAQAAQGLSTAHDHGVIHRDIKPANLMLTPRGLIKVADFGIALASHDVSKKLTGTGEFVGTPGYLSPEVCLGNHVDQRSDIFSLGIVLFEMLAGRMPFTDQSPLGLMLEVVQAEIPDVRTLGATASADLVAVLNKMLAKDANQRYASCHDLLADLQKLDTGVPLSAAIAPGITSASTLPNARPGSAPIGVSIPTAPRAVLPAVPAPLPPMQASPAVPPAMPVANSSIPAPMQAPPSAHYAGPLIAGWNRLRRLHDERQNHERCRHWRG